MVTWSGRETHHSSHKSLSQGGHFMPRGSFRKLRLSIWRTFWAPPLSNGVSPLLRPVASCPRGRVLLWYSWWLKILRKQKTFHVQSERKWKPHGKFRPFQCVLSLPFYILLFYILLGPLLQMMAENILFRVINHRNIKCILAAAPPLVRSLFKKRAYVEGFFSLLLLKSHLYHFCLGF